MMTTEERFQITLHRGPLPAPEQLREYEALMPGAVNRIFTLTERQGTHRQEMERFTVESDARHSTFGMVLGFILSLGVLLVALVMALTGHDHVAGLIAVTDLVSLAGSFLYANHTRRQERLERARLLLGGKAEQPEAPA